MCFSAANALTPQVTIEIPLCSLVATTTKTPVQYEEWHCPACQDLSEEQRETRHGQTESEIWLVNWEQQGSSKDDQINPNYVKMAEELKTGNMSTPGIRIEPTDKIWIKYMDNLARQELEDPNRHTPQWKSTLGQHIRDKVHFDMQPTDP